MNPSRGKQIEAAPAAAQAWTWRTYLGLWAAMSACFAVILGSLLLRYSLRNAEALDMRLQRWKRENALSPGQLEHLRAVEIEFHGRTDLFWRRP